MPKTKLGNYVKLRNRIKTYKNKDKRCKFPFEIDVLGYCWGFALYIDYKAGRITKEEAGNYGVEDYREFCRDCEYWEEECGDKILKPNSKS